MLKQKRSGAYRIRMSQNEFRYAPENLANREFSTGKSDLDPNSITVRFTEIHQTCALKGTRPALSAVMILLDLARDQYSATADATALARVLLSILELLSRDSEQG